MTKKQQTELFLSYIERKKKRGFTPDQTTISKLVGVSSPTRAGMRFEMSVHDGMPDPRRRGDDFRHPRE